MKDYVIINKNSLKTMFEYDSFFVDHNINEDSLVFSVKNNLISSILKNQLPASYSKDKLFYVILIESNNSISTYKFNHIDALFNFCYTLPFCFNLKDIGVFYEGDQIDHEILLSLKEQLLIKRTKVVNSLEQKKSSLQRNDDILFNRVRFEQLLSNKKVGFFIDEYLQLNNQHCLIDELNTLYLVDKNIGHSYQTNLLKLITMAYKWFENELIQRTSNSVYFLGKKELELLGDRVFTLKKHCIF